MFSRSCMAWGGLASQVALGMQALHNMKTPIVHRDLKSGNVLLDAQMNAKVADFGSCRQVSSCRAFALLTLLAHEDATWVQTTQCVCHAIVCGCQDTMIITLHACQMLTFTLSSSALFFLLLFLSPSLCPASTATTSGPALAVYGAHASSDSRASFAQPEQ
jgi:serine/threonine protein kinase